MVELFLKAEDLPNAKRPPSSVYLCACNLALQSISFALWILIARSPHRKKGRKSPKSIACKIIINN